MPETPANPEGWPRGGGYADPVNDFPPFEGEPRNWIIACSQRSGSTLLGDLLGRTGRLGLPAEYLNFSWIGKQMAERLGMPKAGEGFRISEYLQRLYKCRTSPEGFFGMKLQWHQYLRCQGSPELVRLMRSSRIVLLTREDVLAQAVSGGIALASGKWHERPHKAKEARSIDYSRRRVDIALRWILWENWNWQQFFARTGIKPLHVTYEGLVADADGVCRRICRHIGLKDPPRFDLSMAGTKPTADERSADWRRRYEALHDLQPGPDGDPPPEPADLAVTPVTSPGKRKRRRLTGKR